MKLEFMESMDYLTSPYLALDLKDDHSIFIPNIKLVRLSESFSEMPELSDMYLYSMISNSLASRPTDLWESFSHIDARTNSPLSHRMTATHSCSLESLPFHFQSL